MKKTSKATNIVESHAFDHKKAAIKWIGKWEKDKIFEPDLENSTSPFYNLMMFPYPSAEGLHVGNMYAFSGADIYGRFMRMQGNDVFEPIGLDGFGIHSENYALKVGVHPVELAKKTEANFYRQLHEIGNAFAWGSKLETYDPDYYRYTQLIFIKLYKAGLAYRATAKVNWCPNCLTVLADEQVIAKTESGDEVVKYVCERCGTTVKKRDLTQWFFRITAYAEKLLDNLSSLDWSEKVKIAQRNWIGKSEGASIVFHSDIDNDSMITVFTTRPDTIFGVTYLALAIDHPLVIKILSNVKSQLVQEIRSYLDHIKEKGDIKTENKNRKPDNEAKTGVFTGYYAINPLSDKKVPIYISDYVLAGYGTGAVMGVPAHDQRDWEFATKYHIDILEVISPIDGSANESIDNESILNESISQGAFTSMGKLINSDKYNNLKSEDAIEQIIKDLKENKIGSDAKMWHLRDWIISRQRYWGPPIPMVYCEHCKKEKKSWFTENKEVDLLVNKLGWDHFGWYPVSEVELPVKLPYIEKFKPTGSGISPLAADDSFVNVKCPQCGKMAKRETDVSDTFLDSSWYFLRYPSVVREGPVSSSSRSTSSSKQSPEVNQKDNQSLWALSGTPSAAATQGNLPWDKAITKKWLPVNMYIGGAEHSVLHLLYSRFVTMALHDLGLIFFAEPFVKFRAHGLIVKDGAKMSKSKGNVVNPDVYIEKFGVDNLRLYLMFCGRYEIGGDFRDAGMEGMRRFLVRVWKLVIASDISKVDQSELSLRMMNKTIKKVSGDIAELSYNTAIAALMEWMNFLEKEEKVNGEEIKNLLLLLAPFAPVITEELWDRLVSSSQFIVHSKNNNKKSDHELKHWSIHLQEWPKFVESLAQFTEIDLIVQVNGKMRDKIKTERGVAKEKIEEIAVKMPQIAKYLDGKTYKTIFVPDKIINFVTL